MGQTNTHNHPGYLRATAMLAIGCVLLTLVDGSLSRVPKASAASSFRPTVYVNTEAFLVIDDDDTSADVVLRFGDTLSKTLSFNRSLDRFEFNDDVYASGNLSGSGALFIEGNANIDGTTLTVAAASDDVSIGTTSTPANLLIASNALNSNIVTVDSSTTANAIGLGVSLGGAGRIRLNNGVSTNVEIRADGDTYFSAGNVGINVGSPKTKLEVAGAISGSFVYATRSFSGAGLTDCDGGTDKLLWDATTGRFSCGTVTSTSYTAGQGLNVNAGNSFSLNTTVTGAVIQAGNTLASSGSLTWKGAGSGKSITVMQNSYFLGNVGVGASATPEAKLEVTGTISGSSITQYGTTATNVFQGTLQVAQNGTTALTTATPSTIDMGGTVADAITSSKAKIKLYNDGTPSNTFGIGVTSGQFNFFTNASANYKWYANATNTMTLYNVGDLEILRHFTATGNVTAKNTLSGSALTVNSPNNNYLVGNVGVGFRTAPESRLEVLGTISGSALTVNGNGTFLGNVTPNVNNSFDFGSSSARWANGWFNNANLSANLSALGTSSLTGNVGIGSANTTTKAVLNVSGVMSGVTVYATRSFSGAGLSDCDTAGTSKLLWDATTGRFSCGTDQTGSSAYTAGQGLSLNGANSFSLNPTVTGSTVHAVDRLSSSGTAIIHGTEVNLRIMDTVDEAAVKPLIIAKSVSSNASTLYIDSTSGTDESTDGTEVGAYYGNAVFMNREAGGLLLGTNGTYQLGINSAGSVGIGGSYDHFSDPAVDAKLEVVGTVSGSVIMSPQGIFDGNNPGATPLSVYGEYSQTANIFSVGDWEGYSFLKVSGQGNVSIYDGFGFEDATERLEVAGTVSGASLFANDSIRGAGLSDCDNATNSKLLWDATTGRFSCGTDQAGGSGGNWSNTGSLRLSFDARYVRKSGDTMTGSLVIQNGTVHSATLAALLNVRGTMSGRLLNVSGSGASPLLTTTAGKPTVRIGGSGSLVIEARSTDPGSGPANTASLFAQKVGGRTMLHQGSGSTFGASPLQNALFGNQIMMLAAGGGTTVNGQGTTVTNDTTVSHPAADQVFGYMANFATAATSGDDAGTSSTNTAFFRGSTAGANGFFYSARVGVVDTTSIRVFSGMADQTISTMVSADNPAGNHVGFQFSTPRTDANWQFTTKDNTTQNVVNTGMAFTANKVYDLFFTCTKQCASITWEIRNVTDGTSAQGTASSNLPAAATALRIVLGVESETTAAKNIRMQQIYVEADR